MAEAAVLVCAGSVRGASASMTTTHRARYVFARAALRRPIVAGGVSIVKGVRVLVSTVPSVGHIHPVVPLAHALLARGHEVRWATGPDGCAIVEAAGLTAGATGPSPAAMRTALVYGSRTWSATRRRRRAFFAGRLVADVEQCR